MQRPGSGGGMLSQQLSSRRELVEQLDSEPLFDYLMQNGVLERPLVEELKSEKSAVKVNLALLKHLENNGKSAINLFINALRQTGQHHLANLLDDGVRIKALSGSGYLSKARHKGQVSLQIEVKALRLDTTTKIGGDDAKTDPNFPFIMPSREWISLDDIKMRIAELSERMQIRSAADPEDVLMEENHKKSSCICLCFSRLFSRKKDQSRGDIYSQTTPPVLGDNPAKAHTNGYKSGKGSSMQSTPSDSKISCKDYSSDKYKSVNRHSLENLKNIAEIFQAKSDIVYSIVRDTSSASYSQLLKYFEQDRGVLVLDTNCQEGLVIVNICMKMEQLEQLRRDYGNGKLTKDVENCIVTDYLLSRVGAKGIKLNTDIDREEFDLAEQELH